MQKGFQKLEEEAIAVGQKAKQKAQDVQAGVLTHLHKRHLVPGALPGQDDFNPDVIPPDWNIAEAHRVNLNLNYEQRAWEVGHSNKEVNSEVCPCCARHVERKPLSINFHEKNLQFLGSGLPLYFDYIKGCIAILLIFFVTSGDYNLITNFQYGKDCVTGSDCPTTISNRLSMANKRHNTDLVNIQELMNFVSIVVLVVALQFLRKSQREIAEDCDNSMIFASDYSILITGIPTHADNLKNNDYDEDLIDFFTDLINQEQLSPDVAKAENIRQLELGQNYKPLNRVVAVNLCYRLDEQAAINNNKMKQLASLQSTLSKLYSQGYEPGSEDIKTLPEVQDLQQQFDASEKLLDEMELKFYEGKDVQNYFLGSAVLTFQWEQDRDRILYLYRTKTGMCVEKNSDLIYRNQKIQVIEPAEPTDIFWENLHYTKAEKNKRRILGDLVTFVVLGICAGAIYYLSELQLYTTQTQQRANLAAGMSTGDTGLPTPADKATYIIKALSILASLLIVVINSILAMVIAQVSTILRYQGYSTQTKYNISVASKSGIAQFINTALITFLVATILTKNIFGLGGLVQTQTTVFLTNAIIPIIIDLVDGGGLFTSIMQWWEKRKGNRSVKTQQQLNIFMEKPAFVISARYAVLIKNMYFTAFYATIIPVSLVITSFQFFLFIWVERVNIARRRTIKFNYGSELSYEMIDSLEYVLPIYCATNFYWEYSFSHEKNISTWAILGIILGVANALFPMQWLNERIFPSKEQVTNVVPYEDAEMSFLTDYARENPATSERARELFFKRVQKHKKENEKENPIAANLGQVLSYVKR